MPGKRMCMSQETWPRRRAGVADYSCNSMPDSPREALGAEVPGEVEVLIPTRRIDCVTMSYGRHCRQPHPQLTIRTSSALQHGQSGLARS